MDNKARFDSKYSRNPQSLNTPPPRIVTKAVELTTGDNVLELGVGNGRNARYLLDKSLHVTGVDSSQKGLDLLKNEVNSDSSLKLIKSDVMDFQTDERFDLILAIGLLHFLESGDIITLINNMTSWTRKDGIHAVAVRMTQNRRGDLPHIFSSGELKALYEKIGWGVEHYQETDKNNNKIALLISRRPREE